MNTSRIEKKYADLFERHDLDFEGYLALQRINDNELHGIKTDGLQSKNCTGYFDESKDSIIGWWKRCMVCDKIPAEIYHDGFVWHCKHCKVEDYKPKSAFAKIIYWLHNKLK